MLDTRLLVLFQGETLAAHPGYHEGFQRLQSEGFLADYRAIPYYGFTREHGWPALWDEAARQVREYGINAVFLQFFHGSPIPDPTAGIQQLLTCPTKPTLFTSLGDPFGIILRPVPKSYMMASRLAHLNFMTSMGLIAKQLARSGVNNLILMPHGACQVRFSAPLILTSYNPEFDVVFIGSNMRSRWLVGSASWYGVSRKRLVAKLTRRFGSRFGLFGKGWEGHPTWQGAINFDKQHEAIHRSRLQIGGYPSTGSKNDYYLSDRPFIAMAAGIPFIDYWVPGVERMFAHGSEWWLGRSLDEMVNHVERLLQLSDDARLAIGGRARQEILSNHTQYHRCMQMIDIVSRNRIMRLSGKNADPPSLPFLRFDADPKSGPCPAVVNWQA